MLECKTNVSTTGRSLTTTKLRPHTVRRAAKKLHREYSPGSHVDLFPLLGYMIGLHFYFVYIMNWHYIAGRQVCAWQRPAEITLAGRAKTVIYSMDLGLMDSVKKINNSRSEGGRFQIRIQTAGILFSPSSANACRDRIHDRKNLLVIGKPLRQPHDISAIGLVSI